MWDRLRTDAIAAVRGLCTRPAIPLAVVVTVALAAGINLAMLGLIDRALLSPPAHVVEPDRVFTVAFDYSSRGGDDSFMSTTSLPMFETIRDQASAVVTAAASHHIPGGAKIEGEWFSIKAAGVSGEYFRMLGVRAYLGRAIDPDDDRDPSGAPVAVLSHSLWTRAFRGSFDTSGRTVSLPGISDVPLHVIGVMPAGFSGHSADRVDLWIPLRTALEHVPGRGRSRSMAVLDVGVRLAANSTRQAASTQLAAAAGARVMLFPIIGADIAPAPHLIAYWLGAVSIVVFVIGLANSATLLLVRGARQRRERSIRSVLGATRGRLVSVVVVESAVLAVVAGCLALVLAGWLDELVRRVLLPSLIETTGTNTRVVLAALIGSLCAFLLAVTIGAAQIPQRVKPTDLAAARLPWRRSMLQRELLLVQTTLAVLLIAGAGMFGRSYYTLLHQDFGMRMDDVLVASFERPLSSAADQDRVLTNAVSRVRALPGVTGATFFEMLPHAGIMAPSLSVPGRAEPTSLEGAPAAMIRARPELFDILGLSIVMGRPLTHADEAGAPVAIVNETMAQTLWPGTSPLGKCFRTWFESPYDSTVGSRSPAPPASSPCREIVGVARDVRARAVPGSYHSRRMQYYLPYSQAPSPHGPWPQMHGLLVRTPSGGDALTDAIRRVVVDGRTDLPFLAVRRYATLLAQETAPWRIGASLLILFGSLALAIATVGIYAAFAHAASERRYEMAVRLAVGAARGRVLLMMLRESAALAAMGCVCGAVTAVLAGRVTQSMFVGTSSADPLVLGSAGIVMLLVAVLATWLPAHGASRTDPNTLLRAE